MKTTEKTLVSGNNKYKSLFNRSCFYSISSDDTQNYAFELIEESKCRLSAKQISKVVKCELREDTYKGKTFLKLYIRVSTKNGDKAAYLRLDSRSYKRYEGCEGSTINPAAVIFYDLYDPSHTYGTEENNWTFTRVMIANNAIIKSKASIVEDDEEDDDE